MSLWRVFSPRRKLWGLEVQLWRWHGWEKVFWPFHTAAAGPLQSQFNMDKPSCYCEVQFVRVICVNVPIHQLFTISLAQRLSANCYANVSGCTCSYHDTLLKEGKLLEKSSLFKYTCHIPVLVLHPLSVSSLWHGLYFSKGAIYTQSVYFYSSPTADMPQLVHTVLVIPSQTDLPALWAQQR